MTSGESGNVSRLDSSRMPLSWETTIGGLRDYLEELGLLAG